jgi:hypothetical protein
VKLVRKLEEEYGCDWSIELANERLVGTIQWGVHLGRQTLCHAVVARRNLAGQAAVDETYHHDVDILDVEEAHPWEDVRHNHMMEAQVTNLA